MLRVIAVGRDRNDPIADISLAYLQRLQRYFPAELVEVREEPARETTPLARVMAIEAERLRKSIRSGDYVIALDERGKDVSSREIAHAIQRWANEARPRVDFVIGGPNGLDPDFLREAKERWSLSKLTLPHRIARLIVLEQLYRASTILRGEPYHK